MKTPNRSLEYFPASEEKSADFSPKNEPTLPQDAPLEVPRGKSTPETPEGKPVRGPDEDELTWRSRWRRWQHTTQVAENVAGTKGLQQFINRLMKMNVTLRTRPIWMSNLDPEGDPELESTVNTEI